MCLGLVDLLGGLTCLSWLGVGSSGVLERISVLKRCCVCCGLVKGLRSGIFRSRHGYCACV